MDHEPCRFGGQLRARLYHARGGRKSNTPEAKGRAAHGDGPPHRRDAPEHDAGVTFCRIAPRPPGA
jgi:hypothetical protein